MLMWGQTTQTDRFSASVSSVHFEALFRFMEGSFVVHQIVFGLTSNLWTKTLENARLKRRSPLCDCADLDTSFLTLKKVYLNPAEIKVHLGICLIFRSVFLDFQSFTEKPVMCSFAHPMILFLSYLVKSSIDRVSVLYKLAMDWYVMRMCPSWPLNKTASSKASKAEVRQWVWLCSLFAERTACSF